MTHSMKCPACGTTHGNPEADALAAQVANLRARLTACEERANTTMRAQQEQIDRLRQEAKATHAQPLPV